MAYWIIQNDERQGPFTLEQMLGRTDITLDTPVWRDGMLDWGTAGMLPELAPLFTPPAPPVPPVQETPQYGQSADSHAMGNSPTQPPMPPNYLGWSIAATLCCCVPLGIVAIYYSSQVSAAYYTHDYSRAWQMSKRAEMWLILAIVSGLVAMPFVFLYNMVW